MVHHAILFQFLELTVPVKVLFMYLFIYFAYRNWICLIYKVPDDTLTGKWWHNVQTVYNFQPIVNEASNCTTGHCFACDILLYFNFTEDTYEHRLRLSQD